jgi:hypothetical protein
MIPADREWHRIEGAPPEELEGLRSFTPPGLPETYYDLLGFSNGGEGPFGIQPCWFVLYTAEEAATAWTGGVYAEFFPDLFVFGSNGANEAFAFDLKADGVRIVYFDTMNIDLAESVVELATSMEDFIRLIGVDEVDS